ncbi:MAG: dihydroorotase [Lachnospiraceae bacterium]
MIIKNGILTDPLHKRTCRADLKIADGKIAGIAGVIEAEEGEEVIDAAGCYVAPGLIDGHVHFRDPGLTYKEDIHTGALAAAAGGFTTVICMANTKPVADSVETLRYVLEKAGEEKIHVLQAGAVSVGFRGQELTDMEALQAEGACGFTDDGIPLKDADFVRHAMEKAKELDAVLSFHEEDPALITNNGVNRGRASEFYGIGGSPREAEISLVKRDCELAKETGAKINIQHISCAESVELVRQAKAAGACVYAEAAPHHFTLTEEACIKHGTLAKMNPPLRTEADRMAIIRGLQDGTIDMIATDHAPHSAQEKAQSITAAPSGIIGLETSLALGITGLVKTGYLKIEELIEKMSLNPAKIYGLDKGTLEVGKDADLVIFDEEAYTVPRTFCSKAVNTPFIGETLYGRVQYTICGGKKAYSRI